MYIYEWLNFSVSIRVVSLQLCGYHSTTQGQVVLSAVYGQYETKRFQKELTQSFMLVSLQHVDGNYSLDGHFSYKIENQLRSATFLRWQFLCDLVEK